MKDGSFKKISAANIKVGDIIKICQNERVPADLVLLQTTEKSGSVFIRTDQLDGETDWKLRKAIAMTQKCQNLMSVSGEIVANPPNKLIYDFKGYFESADVPMLVKNKSLNDSESMSERTANLLASAQNKDVYREALSL